MRRLLVALAAVAALAPATSAAGSTASRSGATITIVGGPEGSSITTGHGLYSTGIRDTAGITPGPGCEPYGDDGQGVTCGSLFDAVLVADLGDGNDSIGAAHLRSATMHGGPGDDVLDGTDGDDRLYGDAGSDKITGAGGNDLLDGGPGNDQLLGDFFYVDVGGNDTLVSRDGELDEVSCGMGVDRVTADRLDNVYVECDVVDRGPAAPAAGKLRLSARPRPRLASVLRSGLRFTGRFPAAGRYIAEIYVVPAEARRLGLGRKGVRIAEKRGSIRAGSHAIRVRVKQRYRKRLKRARRVSASLIVVGADGRGGVTSAAVRIRLVR
jgi:hypothetical protein